MLPIDNTSKMSLAAPLAARLACVAARRLGAPACATARAWQRPPGGRGARPDPPLFLFPARPATALFAARRGVSTDTTTSSSSDGEDDLAAPSSLSPSSAASTRVAPKARLEG